MADEISAQELHRQAGDLLARIRYRGERFIIKWRGRPAAVMLGVDEYRQLEALAARQRALERERSFNAFEATLEAAPQPEAEPAELTDEMIQSEVDAIREARHAQSGC